MSTPPAPSLRSYQRSARAIGAKSAGALALGALAALPSVADAQISVFTPTGTHTVDKGNGGGVQTIWLGLSTGTVSTDFIASQIRFTSTVSGTNDHIFSYFSSSGGDDVTFALSTGYDARNFTLGATINGARFGSTAYLNGLLTSAGAASGWAGTTGYLGFKSAVGGPTHYGWLKITTNADASVVTLDAIGYNTVASQGITAGQGISAVPEPATSAALLAAGAAGLALYRQRKKIQRPA